MKLCDKANRISLSLSNIIAFDERKQKQIKENIAVLNINSSDYIYS